MDPDTKCRPLSCFRHDPCSCLKCRCFRAPPEEIAYYVRLSRMTEGKMVEFEQVRQLYGNFVSHQHYLDFLTDLRLLETMMKQKEDTMKTCPPSLRYRLENVCVEYTPEPSTTTTTEHT